MQDNHAKAGVLLAIAAYTLWGFAPMYFKLLQGVPATEILMHRILWSSLILGALVLALGQWHKVMHALRNPKVLKILLITGVLLGGNWLLFIWAINSNQMLEASLGYYINPLLNVFLGRVFLAEKLRRLQQLAVGLALVGVGIVVISYGEVPWVALGLAGSFGVYGLMRKQVAVDSFPGLLLETLLMLPFAIGYWVWLAGPDSNMLANDTALNVTLICAGIVTTAPLLCFTAAAKRIMYSTLGFFQYIGPSIMFVLAVFLYDEPLQSDRLVTFLFVWTALALFSFDSYRFYRKTKKQQREILSRQPNEGV
ncbi:Protein RarD [Saliniradius amylolyticus]|uniref:Protein RarD n=1 Tax=Saliniradius amylolyticus TaxID=2183582 RepID=A0A2S2E6S9_9ALTE|nr:EamA family transporter RarD [Saliniradius amylolyticus]AWL13364.1 Protein RarD [Saliniradius amylolyticus]